MLDKIIHRTFRQILSERNIWGYARILWWSWYLVFCICCFPELMMNSIYSYFQLSFVSSAIGFHSNLWDKTSIKIVQFSLDIQGSDIEQNDAYRIAKERWAFPWDFFFSLLDKQEWWNWPCIIFSLEAWKLQNQFWPQSLCIIFLFLL